MQMLRVLLAVVLLCQSFPPLIAKARGVPPYSAKPHNKMQRSTITDVARLLATQHGAKPNIEPTRIIVRFKPGHPLNRFVPSHAFGAGIDGHERGELDQMLSPKNIREMLTAGLKPLSYRLRTELAGEAWHWNPRGAWSEPAKSQGYWASTDMTSTEEAATTTTKDGSKFQDGVSVSYGYRLPRRGNTTDQANDDGYSRLDDGDSNTYWKSNPYLDRYFTGEQNAKLPQWVLIDLGWEKRVNVIRLLWAKPFARVYDVEYGRFADVNDISQALPGVWQTFEHGRIHSGSGGDVAIRLSSRPVMTRFVRVLMKEGSGTADHDSTDVRDRLGYALREIYLGTMDHGNHFHDEIRHAPDNGDQTSIYVSSTDPWHRAADKDELIEQSGLDRIFQSGLTNDLPMLTPVPVLYDTPENAAAEIRYLKARGLPVERVELGEEPDGQFVTPEDYAALYIQFAKAIHAVAPEVKLGGPSFQDIEAGEESGSIQTRKADWLRRFLAYLRERGRLDDYAFFSFEWYPFDDVCQPAAPQLARANEMLTNSLEQMQQGGLSRRIPWIITEYGYSAFGGRVEMDLEGALLNADIVGNFLALGGDQTFLYGYEPNEVLQEVPCSSGNNMLFLIGADGSISYRMPTYYGAWLLTHEWAQADLGSSDGAHELYPAKADNTAGQGALVTAYAVRRPDGLWSLMIVNKDPNNTREVKVKFHNEATGTESEFEGEVDLYQYSRKQYELSREQEPYPIRDQPPEHESLKGLPDLVVKLPAYSLTVVRGAIQLH
ncbi:MAG TPA: glycosyl hydrolase family 5 [Blastocatellia bacterium]|nr:glycosyl hydrolase family 5 [Blastocatellia bacterium]